MEIEFWHWWVAALVFVVVEALEPGTFFLWLGMAAAVVGLLVLGLPWLSWQIQMFAFAVLALAAVLGSRAYVKRHPMETTDPTLNRRSAQYVGRLLILESPIVNGRGRAFVGDTLWSVEGPDMPAGGTVRVIGTDGMILRVEPARHLTETVTEP
jgi:membrane protein implicated in regulation of membrane protease activity